MAVDINLHRVTNVVVEESKMDRDDGTTWFVTKNIIVKDDSDEAVLKLTLFAEDFNKLKFNKLKEVQWKRLFKTGNQLKH